MRRSCAVIFLLAVECARGDNLPQPKELTVSGDAKLMKEYVRLTRSKQYQGGSVWLRGKQYVRGGFDTRFSLRFTDPRGLGPGADGIAFVVQNNGPGSLGGLGGAGGFAEGRDHGLGGRSGIAFSLAVFFDSFHNAEFGDPSDNALHVCVNGRPRELRWPSAKLAVVPRLKRWLKDGNEHSARVTYNPPILSVYMDDELLVNTPADLSLFSDADGKAWVGFTASTGGGYENHDLLSWNWRGVAESSVSMVESTISFLLKECLPGRNLCTPEEAVVEEKGAGMYRVVLPAHLEWGASIPNPAGRSAEIVNAQGLVCWDSARGADGCGGPGGALISRTQGVRTQFPVRDESGKFSDNQGYFEFEVRLK